MLPVTFTTAPYLGYVLYNFTLFLFPLTSDINRARLVRSLNTKPDQ